MPTRTRRTGRGRRVARELDGMVSGWYPVRSRTGHVMGSRGMTGPVPSAVMSTPPAGLRARRPVTTLFAVITTATMALGVAPPAVFAASTAPAAAACVPTVNPDWSAARVWDEAALDAIRRDLPRPTVHARNLFHMSAAMWDAWAAYDPTAQGYFTTDKLHASDVEAARSEAISYAAYRILSAALRHGAGRATASPEFDATIASQCYDADVTTIEGDTPAALGNRIAATAIAYGLTDGSNEQENYTAPATYAPVNEPLIVDRARAPR